MLELLIYIRFGVILHKNRYQWPIRCLCKLTWCIDLKKIYLNAFLSQYCQRMAEFIISYPIQVYVNILDVSALNHCFKTANSTIILKYQF